MADQISYPMFSERSWWIIRDRFIASIPTVVSTNYVKSLLTLSSDASANNNIIGPMKRLGLLTDDGKPTDLAKDWRIDDKYSATCAKIVKNTYPQELLDLFPETTVDRNIAKNWFMNHGVGNKTADQMVALFSLLKSGKIKDKSDRTAPDKKSLPKIKNVKNGNGKPSTQELAVSPITAPKQENESPMITSNRPNLHIDLQIHISPESTPEQIETIFASMAKHLYGVDNK